MENNNLVVLNEVFIISEQIILGKTFRIYGDFSNPLFMAKEIAEWIDHNKPSEMIDNIDNDPTVLAMFERLEKELKLDVQPHKAV